MYTLSIAAETFEELRQKMQEFIENTAIGTLSNIMDYSEEKPQEIKPVLTQEQMAENVANAPEHTMPEQPSIEEVRAALKDLRDRKGAAAVREVLKAYGADSLPTLDPDNYLGVRDRALAEV